MQFTFSYLREPMHYTPKVIFPSIRVNENSVEYKHPVCESPAQVINNKWQEIPVYNCNNLQKQRKHHSLEACRKNKKNAASRFVEDIAWLEPSSPYSHASHRQKRKAQQLSNGYVMKH